MMKSVIARFAAVAVLFFASSFVCSAQQWTPVSGAAKDVAIGANGTVWVVGSDNRPYRYNGTAWTFVEAQASRIAVDASGQPWIVSNEDMFVKRYDGQQWINTQSGKVQDIAIGANGWVYVVDGRTGSIRISKDNGVTWNTFGGDGYYRVTESGNGNLWAIKSSSKEIWRTIPGTLVWIKTPGSGTDVGASQNGDVWAIGLNGSPYRWEGGNFVMGTGTAAQIAAGPDYAVWVANSAQQIFRAVQRTLVAGNFISTYDESTLGADTSDSAEPATWLTSATRNWMRRIPDTTPLNRISIPGTHDTATYNYSGAIPFAVRTQSWSVTEQLRAGIRYLDIRVRATGGNWSLHHHDYYLDMQFDTVAREVSDFLRAHPYETVLMRIKQDKSSEDGALNHDQILANYVAQYPWMFYDRHVTGQTLLLGDVRGKVVLLRSDSMEDNLPQQYGPGWSQLDVQDDYTVNNPADLTAKYRAIATQVQEARVAAPGPRIYINHLSCVGLLTPKDCADGTNASAFPGLSQRGVSNGVIIMDYPGERLIYRVIKSNFAN